MQLKLTRPIAIFDLETTGLNITTDRIVEIAIIRVEADGSESEFLRRVNPCMPIPAEVSAIHGIFDEDIAEAPKFDEIADEVVEFIGDSDLAGYNSNKFDIPVLAEELMRAGCDFDVSSRRFVDVQNIFHKMEQRTLAAAYQFYCEKPMENAHNALYDARVTLDVFRAQLDRYDSLENNVDYLSSFSKAGNYNLLDFAGRLAINEHGEAMYNFGKHKGKTIREVMRIEPGYYGWMLDADFPLYTKKCLRAEMDKMKADREEAKKDDNTDLNAKLEALKNKFK
ncbi:MAG: exonuclease domain-containing protein [Flavobacteriia bacterium]|jgi:DNA polymerase-3 subunit epsilon|nr:3'-5' exonuclease [Cryomorphaceae bacterium]